MFKKCLIFRNRKNGTSVRNPRFPCKIEKAPNIIHSRHNTMCFPIELFSNMSRIVPPFCTNSKENGRKNNSKTRFRCEILGSNAKTTGNGSFSTQSYGLFLSYSYQIFAAFLSSEQGEKQNKPRMKIGFRLRVGWVGYRKEGPCKKGRF